MGARPLCIRFDKIDGFIKIYNGTRYLVLFAPRICDTIYDKIRDLIIDKMALGLVLVMILVKSVLIYVILYEKKKALTFYNVNKDRYNTHFS